MEPAVFHVDDDPLVRRSVETVMRSVGTPYRGYPTAQAFLDAWAEDAPGCLVSDMRMPGLGGMELLRLCAARKFRLPVIFLTAYAEVGLAVAAMKAGVFDFLEKPCGDQALLEAVQGAIAEDARRRAARARHGATAARLAQLSRGEYEVLGQMVEGKNNKAIAAALRVSVKTVEARRARVMEKLQVESLVELMSRILGYRLWSEQEG
jgi:FixJ family two-component response regulator